MNAGDFVNARLVEEFPESWNQRPRMGISTGRCLYELLCVPGNEKFPLAFLGYIFNGVLKQRQRSLRISG